MKLLWQRLRHMLTPLAGADQAVNLAGNAAIEMFKVSKLAGAHCVAFFTVQRNRFGLIGKAASRLFVDQANIAFWAVGQQPNGAV